MSSYIGRHAELYDIFYADKPYVEEATFVHRCLQQYGEGTTRSLLELACGTGSHALALEEFDYQITAVDYSQHMIERAKRKADGTSAIDFRLADMRALDLENKSFDAVVCLFDSIGYVQTTEAIKEVLRRVHDHLRVGGLFIFEFWHAAAMLRSFDPVRVRRWATPQGEIVRISETRLECEKQLAHVTYSIYELDRNGTYSSLTETQVNRYFLVQEMAALLESCKLTPVRWFNGFQDDKAVDESSWHVVGLARKSDSGGV